MKHGRVILCAVILAAVGRAARAGDAIPPAANPAAAVAPGSVARDPFWPIGYRSLLPDAAREPVAAAEPGRPAADLQARAQRQLRIGGIVRSGGAYVAQVNGHLVRAGEEIRVTLDGQTVVFVVQSISMERVVLAPRAPRAQP